MGSLQICADSSLEFPIDLVTQTIVAYGGKGSGKTNLCAVIAEECSAAGLRFSLLDPVGVSWGLVHSADRKHSGLHMLVLGGRHGDLPIEPTGGAVVADLVADEEIDTLIDISRHPNGKMWGVGDRIRFVTDYCLRLYERQGERMRPMMQLIDECGRFCPQNPPKGAVDITRCMGAIEQLVELGRNVGVGVTLITQRSARMNKSISELAECMFAFRTVGPRSVDAIMDWCSDNVEKESWKEIRETVRSLPRGSALVVSPGWLDHQGVVKVRHRHTFDSSATPSGGDERRAPGRTTKPDLAKYRDRMAETIAHVEAANPKVLQKRVADLETKLAAAQEMLRSERRREPVQHNAAPTRVEVPVLDDESQRALLELARDVKDVAGDTRLLATEIGTLADRVDSLSSATLGLSNSITTRVGSFVNGQGARDDVRTRRRSRTSDDAVAPSSDLHSGMARVLAAAAQHGTNGVDRPQITALTGFKKTTRDAYVRRLKNAGLIEVMSIDGADRVVATRDGVNLLGPDFERLPTGHALYQHWMQRLPEGEGKILEAVAQLRGRMLDRDAITKATGFKKTTRDAYIRRLKRRHLVSVSRDGVQAVQELFG